MIGFDKSQSSYKCIPSTEVSCKTSSKRLSANKVARVASPYAYAFGNTAFALA